MAEISQSISSIPKSATGIGGFDDITQGGFPAGRTSLVCGSAGCGKTMFAMSFLVNGAARFDEPGVLVTFEERPEDIAANVRSLHYDVPGLVAAGKLMVDHVHIEAGTIEEVGEYDLDGLFVRLAHAIGSVGAKRVVLDTIEALFASFSEEAVLRAELRRLFGWLRDQGVTTVVTGERGDGQLTRRGLEEYVSDCVVLLDNRVHDQVSTRRLRVVKYRGSAHGGNEYPFLIDEEGITVLPVTGAGLHHKTSDETVSTGVRDLDAMLEPGGYFRGSSILLSGLAGTGKTVFGAQFANATCARGERCLYFAFEESPDQIVRNMRSVGLELQPHIDSGHLRILSARPSLYGFEMHLARMNREVERFAPTAVVVDPIAAFRGPEMEIHATLLRMIDLFKSRGITALLTSLSPGQHAMTAIDHSVSSLMDTWVSLQTEDVNGERNRTLYVFKSRGMRHSNQIREYVLSDTGVTFAEVYVGTDGVLTGTARLSQEAKERADAVRRRQEIERRRRELSLKRATFERRIAEMRSELEDQERELKLNVGEEEEREMQIDADRQTIGARRGRQA